VEESLNELALLADTAGAEVVDRVVQRRHSVHPAYFIGTGKAKEIAERCEEEDIDLVIFDDDLTPAQVKNLDKLIERRILDRSGLILDIFASRARSHQARLQVELAQLQYMMPRLTRQWSHLSRQEGGVGAGGAIGVRGPGETQLETDRRLIRRRIIQLTQALEEVSAAYQIQRRQRNEMFCAALVGYTNAGKSTVFNAFTGAGTLIENRLFATLDSTTRIIHITERQKTLLSDTVGFIRKLPHHLIASFKSTLSEVYNADLLLHIVDASHPLFAEQITTVNTVLEELGVTDRPTILVFNKIDRIEEPDFVQRLMREYPDSIQISALDPAGIEALRRTIARHVDDQRVEAELLIPYPDLRHLHAFYEAGDVLSRVDEPEGVRVTVRLMPSTADRMHDLINAFSIDHAVA
jgi:GTP-binding protein HflX